MFLILSPEFDRISLHSPRKADVKLSFSSGSLEPEPGASCEGQRSLHQTDTRPRGRLAPEHNVYIQHHDIDGVTGSASR
ncbi:hypothetical protein EYF80_067088 [Liparis tanakae]|uniref:Uncharacterized protein n=1 Tax=Liparis tanakae TaxID=230148 RepID=A0A4Z2E1P7_9TELE|nr:hypothetical protein EYF80_067088 [Liparis tanakae]